LEEWFMIEFIIAGRKAVSTALCLAAFPLVALGFSLNDTGHGGITRDALAGVSITIGISSLHRSTSTTRPWARERPG
jgi:hypothetical protein